MSAAQVSEELQPEHRPISRLAASIWASSEPGCGASDATVMAVTSKQQGGDPCESPPSVGAVAGRSVAGRILA